MRNEAGQYKNTGRINGGGGYKPRERSSNFELLRIIGMLLIIAHHSVVNSGITAGYDYDNITPNMVFLQLWGMWGKMAINIFVLITGYFMCNSRLTWQRFAKIWMETKFYKVIFFAIFFIAGYEVLTLTSVFKLIFGYINGINSGFTSSFLAFYLFIPFMNALIEKLGKGGLEKLILLLLGIFTISSTFFFSTMSNEVFWYVTLYFVAAYIRLYPNRLTEDARFAAVALSVSVVLSYASVIVVDFVGYRLCGFTSAYHMVSDSNKFLAFSTAVSIFLLFKNLNIKNSKVINTIAKTTFGVLCIHANSDAMRQWLWKDLLKLPTMYDAPFFGLVVSYIVIMFGVFAVCSVIDLFRIYLLEKPLFKWLDKNTENIEGSVHKILGALSRRVSRIINS